MNFPRDNAGHVTKTISATARPAQPSAMASTLWWTDPTKRNRFLKEYRTQVASGASTIIATLISTPLENLKTRMQTAMDTVLATCGELKVFGDTLLCTQVRWSRLLIKIRRSATTRECHHCAGDQLYRLPESEAYGFGYYRASYWDVTFGYYNTPGSVPTLATLTTFTIGGMAAGLAAAPLACPFELAKNVVQTSVLMANRAQAQASAGKIPDKSPLRDVKRLTTSEAIKQIISRHGIRGLYTGVQLHALRDTIGTGMYFAIYETTKQLISTYQGDHGSPFGAPMVAGALCGVIPWICTYGLDTKKTRAQSILLGKSNEINEATVAAARSSTYRGMTVLLFRTSVQNMILLSTFEYIKMKINELPLYDEKPQA
ncbi:hypothetical protein CIHG_04705 [Coccidioides immitis H538.4]|uniref:Mitochondrial carrier protein n=1 Tax=Coccidioides immitis H538.4 TaxID=396776 RepID=A0A0J8RQA2_COCIT|nr:hypothetical protein CIHG_04705 [Coccidioides immitis H538.4]